MRKTARVIGWFGVCVLGALVFAHFAGAKKGITPIAVDHEHYVCAPCGMPCDSKVYDAPGVCPVCGAALVVEPAPPRAPRKKVALLIFDGVEIIDYTGPYEVFGDADFDVYTVAEAKAPVTTAMGMAVVPKYTFADAPPPDVLVVPGGDVHAPRGSAATLKWIAGITATDEQTMSVCNGAFILAAAGILDGLSATTTAHLIAELAAEYPKTKVVSDQRFVDNGKIVTTGGLSAGIDGALHVVEKMLGRGRAQAVALDIEYDWRPDSGFVRAKLADNLIPHVGLDELGNWSWIRTQGGVDRWEIVVTGTSELSVAELMVRISESLAKGKWTTVQPASPTETAWKFNGPDGRPWTGAVTIESVAGESHRYTATVRIVET
jgi:putative intracellular protease/amidase